MKNHQGKEDTRKEYWLEGIVKLHDGTEISVYHGFPPDHPVLTGPPVMFAPIRRDNSSLTQINPTTEGPNFED